MDQLAAQTKLGFIYSRNILPYAHGGYTRVLNYGRPPLRSKNSWSGGFGALIAGGIVNVDWTASRAYNSILSQTVMLGVNLAL